MTGIVRLCNGEICYWPNLGNGRFGAKLTMDNTTLTFSQSGGVREHLSLAKLLGCKLRSHAQEHHSRIAVRV